MTRKRFVKILMGKYGYSRNDANRLANVHVWCCIPYRAYNAKNILKFL